MMLRKDNQKDNQVESVCNTGDESGGHCITCSDEALPVRVLKINFEQSMALVELLAAGQTGEIEVDISLVEPVECGDLLLVQGGVALGRSRDEPSTLVEDFSH